MAKTASTSPPLPAGFRQRRSGDGHEPLPRTQPLLTSANCSPHKRQAAGKQQGDVLSAERSEHGQTEATNPFLDALAHFLHAKFKELDGFHDMQLPEVYNGELSHAQREQLLGRFKRADASKRPILLLNMNSASVGLNLQYASGVIFTDMDWEPVKHAQSLARAWRIGQKRDVRVAFLYPMAAPNAQNSAVPLNTLESWIFKSKVLAKRDNANVMYRYLDPDYVPRLVDNLDFRLSGEVEKNDAYKIMLKLRSEYFIDALTPAEQAADQKRQARLIKAQFAEAKKRVALEKRDKEAMEIARRV